MVNVQTKVYVMTLQEPVYALLGLKEVLAYVKVMLMSWNIFETLLHGKTKRSFFKIYHVLVAKIPAVEMANVTTPMVCVNVMKEIKVQIAQVKFVIRLIFLLMYIYQANNLTPQEHWWKSYPS